MKRASLIGAGAVALFLVLPVQGQDKKPPRKPTDVVEAEKILPPGTYAGKILTLSGNLFTLRIEYQTLELKPGYRPPRNANRQVQNLINQQSKLAQLQMKAQTARTPKQYASYMRQIQQQTANLQNQALRLSAQPQQSPFRLVQRHQDVEMEMAVDVKIRTDFLPVAYDDMGDPKKYTKEEIKELKGPNPKERGYKAELDALKVGQEVSVTMARVKEKKELDTDPPTTDAKDDKKDKKDPAAKDAKDEKKDPAAKDVKDEKKDPAAKDVKKEKDPEEKDPKKKVETRLLSTKILILKESDQPTSPGDKKKN